MTYPKSKEAFNDSFNQELINMKFVQAIFYFKDNTILTIYSDKGIYNNITNDMNFSENVKMDYLENILFSDRATFNNFENQLLIAGNINGSGPTANLKATAVNNKVNIVFILSASESSPSAKTLKPVIDSIVIIPTIF